VTHRGPQVGVGGGFLHIPQWYAEVTGSDESVPQGVRPDGLGDPGEPGDPADDPPGAVPVQPPAACGEEHRPVAALADREVDGPGGARASGTVTTLPPLQVITRVRCPRSMPMASMSAPWTS
jgi:hypothetical protein